MWKRVFTSEARESPFNPFHRGKLFNFIPSPGGRGSRGGGKRIRNVFPSPLTPALSLKGRGGVFPRCAVLAGAVFALFILSGCEAWRAIVKRPAVYPLELAGDFDGALGDDMDTESLKTAAQRSLEYLGRVPPSSLFSFGKRAVTAEEMKISMSRLIEIFETVNDPEKRSRTIAREFEVYTGTGETRGGNVLVTGYYQPLLDGRREKDETFKWPIYRRPDDLVTADLGLFSSDLKGRSVSGMVEKGRFVPYHDREKIDGAGALAGRGLEIAWAADPVALFILHVQGSGMVRFEDGSRIFVNYAAANGREYRSIGRLLIGEGAISREEMSLEAIRKWFENHPEEIQRVLYANPSYVFFREMDDGPFGATGVKLVDGRSAAFDRSLFPAGAIAHVSVELPVVEDGAVTGWRKTQRFVFNHDTGGAIKGAGRMDLFFGAGAGAGAAAGAMKHPGQLRFLVLKPRVLAAFKSR